MNQSIQQTIIQQTIDELREYKVGFVSREAKLSYTPCICERAADLIEQLAQRVSELENER